MLLNHRNEARTWNRVPDEREKRILGLMVRVVIGKGWLEQIRVRSGE